MEQFTYATVFPAASRSGVKRGRVDEVGRLPEPADIRGRQEAGQDRDGLNRATAVRQDPDLPKPPMLRINDRFDCKVSGRGPMGDCASSIPFVATMGHRERSGLLVIRVRP